MFVRYILLLFIFSLSFSALSQNVPPTISDPEQLETIRKERQAIFDELIEDPTNPVSYTHLTLPTSPKV